MNTAQLSFEDIDYLLLFSFSIMDWAQNLALARTVLYQLTYITNKILLTFSQVL